MCSYTKVSAASKTPTDYTSTTSYFHKNCGGQILEHNNVKRSLLESEVPSGSGSIFCDLCNAQIGGWTHSGGYDSNGVYHDVIGGGGGMNAHTCYACKKCGSFYLTSSDYFTPTYTIAFNKNY